ncbi:MAG TPA: NfeD family protein [Candidatus Paceibacterota bacterium]|nr:hypothetical protein [Verrucomicrobiota bacterium]HOX00980.1 NfeD family protein [Verrucomicrobiota bacterium]HRZ43754.1 NfeD family protein [Candidatus Paceibacterota bacterium]
METVVILILAGAVLLVLETILPGLVAGTLGLGCLVAAVAIAYAQHGVRTGHWTLGLVSAGLAAGALAYLRFFPNSRAARVFISTRQVGGLGNERPELMNQSGTAYTHLRPSGVATIQGQRVDVVSEGPFIERGMAVRVVAVEGGRVVVRAIMSPS